MYSIRYNQSISVFLTSTTPGIVSRYTRCVVCSCVHRFSFYFSRPDFSPTAAAMDLRSMGVAPNDTFSYIWKLTADDGPLDGDPQCLTQLYQSTVSLERDLASGLVGTLLICKHHAIDMRGRLVREATFGSFNLLLPLSYTVSCTYCCLQLGPDKEWPLMFAVFDENRSWYAKENIHKPSSNTHNTTDAEFYNSNVIYSEFTFDCIY